MIKTIDELMFINDGHIPYSYLFIGRGGLGFEPTEYNIKGSGYLDDIHHEILKLEKIRNKTKRQKEKLSELFRIKYGTLKRMKGKGWEYDEDNNIFTEFKEDIEPINLIEKTDEELKNMLYDNIYVLESIRQNPNLYLGLVSDITDEEEKMNNENKFIIDALEKRGITSNDNNSFILSGRHDLSQEKDEEDEKDDEHVEEKDKNENFIFELSKLLMKEKEKLEEEKDDFEKNKIENTIDNIEKYIELTKLKISHPDIYGDEFENYEKKLKDYKEENKNDLKIITRFFNSSNDETQFKEKMMNKYDFSEEKINSIYKLKKFEKEYDKLTTEQKNILKEKDKIELKEKINPIIDEAKKLGVSDAIIKRMKTEEGSKKLLEEQKTKIESEKILTDEINALIEEMKKLGGNKNSLDKLKDRKKNLTELKDKLTEELKEQRNMFNEKLLELKNLYDNETDKSIKKNIRNIFYNFRDGNIELEDIDDMTDNLRVEKQPHEIYTENYVKDLEEYNKNKDTYINDIKDDEETKKIFEKVKKENYVNQIININEEPYSKPKEMNNNEKFEQCIIQEKYFKQICLTANEDLYKKIWFKKDGSGNNVVIKVIDTNTYDDIEDENGKIIASGYGNKYAPIDSIVKIYYTDKNGNRQLEEIAMEAKYYAGKAYNIGEKSKKSIAGYNPYSYKDIVESNNNDFNRQKIKLLKEIWDINQTLDKYKTNEQKERKNKIVEILKNKEELQKECRKNNYMLGLMMGFLKLGYGGVDDNIASNDEKYMNMLLNKSKRRIIFDDNTGRINEIQKLVKGKWVKDVKTKGWKGEYWCIEALQECVVVDNISRDIQNKKFNPKAIFTDGQHKPMQTSYGKTSVKKGNEDVYISNNIGLNINNVKPIKWK